MSWHVGVGGAWRQISKPYVGVGGTWRTVAKMWIGVGGAWREFYANLAAFLSGRTVEHTAFSPANATAGIKVDNDGYIYSLVDSAYTQREQWMLAGTVAEYECRWTNSSGTLSSGTAATWQVCSTDRVFTVTYTTNSPGSKTCTGLLEIRMVAAPNTVLASATYIISAIVE